MGILSTMLLGWGDEPYVDPALWWRNFGREYVYKTNAGCVHVNPRNP
jgi:hypothetical protein